MFVLQSAWDIWAEAVHAFLQSEVHLSACCERWQRSLPLRLHDNTWACSTAHHSHLLLSCTLFCTNFSHQSPNLPHKNWPKKLHKGAKILPSLLTKAWIYNQASFSANFFWVSLFIFAERAVLFEIMCILEAFLETWENPQQQSALNRPTYTQAGRDTKQELDSEQHSTLS